MEETLSKSKIDQLGERLKAGLPSETDLILLDHYRQSFGNAYGEVLRIVGDTLCQHGFNTAPTGRSAKSTTSIIDKLRRETVRLSQIQDIAGCRVMVTDVTAQDEFVRLLSEKVFPKIAVIDRRDRPSHGYRAVHLVACIGGKPVEIQIRSLLQHLWAELSERLSDKLDASIKYGGGSELIRGWLSGLSEKISILEKEESEYCILLTRNHHARSEYEARKRRILLSIQLLLIAFQNIKE